MGFTGFFFTPPVDGSEIPNNHLGCIKPCEERDEVAYQHQQCERSYLTPLVMFHIYPIAFMPGQRPWYTWRALLVIWW